MSAKHPRPLVPVVLALMGGLVCGYYLPGLAVSAVLVALCLVAILLAGKAYRLPVLILSLFLAYGHWSIGRWSDPHFPENHLVHFVDDAFWEVTGVVDSPLERFADRTRFVLQAEALSRGKAYHAVTGAVRVTVRETLPEIAECDKVRFSARLKEIRNFNNPGAFDYRQLMAFQGIHVSASVGQKARLRRLGRAEGSPLGQILLKARQEVSRLFDRAPMGTPRGVVRALITGARYEIPPDTRDLFSRVGIAHLLAISGLHIGIVASLAFFAFRFLLSRFETILLAAWAERGAAVLSAVPVVGYGLLAGPSAATQRAVLMVLVFLAAVLLGRQQDLINTLAGAALLILLATPTALFAASFQLSFSAVFAIFYVREKVPLFAHLTTHRANLMNRFYLFLLVSGTAILGTLPITVRYFNQTSLIGLAANCVMVPLVGFLVVPLGLLAVCLLPITGVAALWVLERAMDLMGAALGLAVIFDQVPFSSLRVVTPTLLEIALFYGAAWSLLNLGRNKAARAVLVLVVLAVVADGTYWLNRRFFHRDLRVTFLDVGQGNAALLQLPGGRCMLVDGGGFFENRFDVGARVVAPFLWSQKIGRVETLILSHPHPDHLNGLLFVAENFHVREVWMTGEETEAGPFRQFQELIAAKEIRRVGLAELTRPRTVGGVRLEILYPPLDFLARRNRERWRTANNNSLVLKATMEDVSFLFPGDIEKEAEVELLSLRKESLDTDVLLIPHHGSRTSSTEAFLKCVSPQIAVASAGWKNIFRFPHKEVLERCEVHGCQVLRTDQNGAVTITTDGKTLRTATHGQRLVFQ